MGLPVLRNDLPGVVTLRTTRFTTEAPLRTLSDLYLHSPSANAPLRIGLLLDTPELSRVSASVLDDIARSNFARVELVVFNAASQPASAVERPASAPRRVRQLLTSPFALWGAYNRVDQRLWRVDDDPLLTEDVQPALDGIESLTIEPLTSGFVHRFPPEAVERVRAAQLDVLIRFGFNILRGEILSAARYGVWSFHHGDNDYYRGGPAHFWELYERNPISGVMLQILTDELDAGRVLAKGLFSTEPGLSHIRNRVRPYWGSAHLVIQKLWELHTEGWEFVEKRILPAAPYQGKRKLYRRPTNRQVAGWLAREAIRRISGRATRAVVRSGDVVYWRMAIRTGGDLLSADGTPDMKGFQWVQSPAGHCYADPFVTERDGRHWIFFEDYSFLEERGRITCAEISPAGTLGCPRVALDAGDHLSFPHVFSEGDALYMIPESASAGAVRLYRCTRFPDRWRHVADLFHGPARDTAVWKQDGLWWFFTTLVDPRGRGFALYLFFSESLQGKWHYHPANPISFDARNARCAGRVFETAAGRLIRPSQDSRWRYGYALGLNEIVRLTPTEFEERRLQTVEPNWCRGLRGCHTYNRAGTVEVIDGQTLRPRHRL